MLNKQDFPLTAHVYPKAETNLCPGNEYSILVSHFTFKPVPTWENGGLQTPKPKLTLPKFGIMLNKQDFPLTAQVYPKAETNLCAGYAYSILVSHFTFIPVPTWENKNGGLRAVA
jgi:hypothetical protein